MTDRFKFRAWLIAYNKYIYDIQNVGCDFSIKCNEDCFGDFLGEDKYIVEQCTGLKDKNGKLIYEGDIVEFDGDFHGDIAWDEDAGCWAIRTTENTIYTFDNLYGYELEVVGNIHENKELLDD